MLHKINTYYFEPINIYNKYLCMVDTKESDLNPIFVQSNLDTFLNNIKKQYNINYELIISLSKLYQDNANPHKLIENMVKPNDFDEYLNSLEIKEYDIVDLYGYRGSGYYYVYLHDNELYVTKTLGEYGYYLPYEANKMIKMKNIKSNEDFDNDHVLGFQIPNGVEIKNIKTNSSLLIDNDNTFIDFSFSPTENEDYEIEGTIYSGVLLD